MTIEPVLLSITVGVSETADQAQTASSLQMIFLLSLIALVPSLILMITSFPRFLISFHFLRSALGTQQMPPNQILIALALFLTFFLHAQDFKTMYDDALMPYSRGEISQEEAIEVGIDPFREFMFGQVEQKDIDLFARIADKPYNIEDKSSVPNTVLIPAFMVGEMTKAFKIGMLIYIPFIVIDMVVASTLMAMGMMMLPPAMISLPFKIMLFVMIDGWNLFISEVFNTFNR
jgi:flagellar biosynthetic protein FliP